MKIINLTPHNINIVGELYDKDGKVVDYCNFMTIKPSGQLARVATRTVQTGEIEVTEETIPHISSLDGGYVEDDRIFVPITETKYSEVEGLPNPEDGVVYVVSSLVAQRVPERRDVFIPNESVRDSEGRIIGCKSLGRI